MGSKSNLNHHIRITAEPSNYITPMSERKNPNNFIALDVANKIPIERRMKYGIITTTIVTQLRAILSSNESI